MNWNLTFDGSPEVYVFHTTPEGARKFVARFKYARPRSSAKHFARFLVANFTPESYFAECDAGKAPLTVLKSKGYVSLNESLGARRAI